jgi:thiamine-phosphate pyrophosphorylase
MQLRGLYAIVDPSASFGREPVALAEAIVRGGCTALQLRDKREGDRERVRLARQLQAVCARHGVPFIVDDRVDIALLSGASGVHLGQHDLGHSDARKLAAGLRIGRSTHSAEQAVAAWEEGAEYVGFGPIHPTSSKANPEPVVGLDALSEVCAKLMIPVVAIGGITQSRIPELRARGVRCAAAISELARAEDPERAARALHEALS